jgi:hypothetical protein
MAHAQKRSASIMKSLHPFAKPEYAVNWLRERAQINRVNATIPPEQWEANVLPYIADRLDASADLIDSLAEQIEVSGEIIAQLRGFAEAHKTCRGSDEAKRTRYHQSCATCSCMEPVESESAECGHGIPLNKPCWYCGRRAPT